MKKNNSSKKRGFTIIEMIVVISIISVLAGIVAVSVGTVRQKGLMAAADQSFQEIAKAIYLHYQGDWPTVLSGGYQMWTSDCQNIPGEDQDYSCIEENPPFVQSGLYSSWDASRFCKDCAYTLFLIDGDKDGKIGCAIIDISAIWGQSFDRGKFIITEDCDLKDILE